MDSAATTPAWAQPAPTKPIPKRWLRFAVIATGLAACAGSLAWLVLWLQPPEPARLIVWEAGYERNLQVPHNALARNAIAHIIAEARQSGKLRTDSAPNRFTRGSAERMLQTLQNTRESTIVLAIAAHGAADEQGPYLLPDDCTANSEHRLHISKLLEILKELPARTRKIVLLDATQPQAYPNWGITHNGFADALIAMNSAIETVPNLCIINSSSRDERSWNSPEERANVFWHSIQLGVQGEADANRDDRLNALELFEFTSARVRNWARNHRDTQQNPLLLPEGRSGVDRARSTHIAIVNSDRPLSVEPPRVISAQPELEELWNERDVWARSNPAPYTLAPVLWHQYQAWLMRYEELLFHQSDRAGEARIELDKIREQLPHIARLDVASRSQSLALAPGLAKRSALPNLSAEVAKLVEAPNADRQAMWNALQKVPGNAGEFFTIAMLRSAIQWSAVDPPTRLPKLLELAPILEPGLRNRPAEWNFALGLAHTLRDIPKDSRRGNLVRELLELRILAEETACGIDTELVLPACQEQWKKADIQRRNAEDLVFDSREAQWQRAETYANNAREEYQRAARSARLVVHMEQARWRCWETMFCMAEWLADGPEPNAIWERKSREQNLRAVLQLGKQLHDLTANEPAKATEETVRAIQNIAVKLDGMLETERAQVAEKLLKSRPQPNEHAREIAWLTVAEHYLACWPTPNESTLSRRRITQEARNVSRQLAIEARTATSETSIPSAEQMQMRVFTDARRRGLLATAIWNEADWLQLRGDAKVAQDDFAFRYEELPTRADLRQQAIAADAILNRVMLSAQNFAEKPLRPSTSMEPLLFADRISRRSFVAEEFEPAKNLRAVRTGNLLANQAERTLRDHWWAADTSQPYYLSATRNLLADAQRLEPKHELNPTFFPYSLGNAAPFPLRPELPIPKLVQTDNVLSSVTFHLAPAPAEVPLQGFVALASDASTWTTQSLGEPAPLQTVAIPAVQKVPPATPQIETDIVNISGFFRGQNNVAPLTIERHRTPDSHAVRVPQPETVAVAVRADADVAKRYGTGSGSIAFVLDCTGSMRAPDSQPADAASYWQAVDKCVEIIKQLPAGVSISVSIFGARGEDSPEAAYEQVQAFRDRKEVELESLIGTLRNKEAWNRSAVVRAVFRTFDDLKNQPEGTKAIVLLSDCADTRFATDSVANPKKQAIGEALLAKFDGSGIALHVLAFPTDDAVQQQFSVVKELKPRGVFVPPAESATITKALLQSVGPRVKIELTSTETRQRWALQSGTPDFDNWTSTPLNAGRYTLAIPGTNTTQQPIELLPGERLLARLTDANGTLRWERAQYLAEARLVARTPAQARSDWNFGILRSNLREAGGLELLAGLENTTSVKDLLQPARVGDAWFATTGVPVETRLAKHWQREVGFPVPMWKLETAAWMNEPGSNAPAAPAVKVWWTPDEAFRPVLQWNRGANDELAPRQVAIARVAVHVESAAIEAVRVQVRPNEWEPRQCVVIRLYHPQQAAMWAKPSNSNPSGSEVRIYEQAQRTTALYWWADAQSEAAILRKIRGWDFLSLLDIQQTAEKLQYHKTLSGLPVPQAAMPPFLPPAR